MDEELLRVETEPRPTVRATVAKGAAILRPRESRRRGFLPLTVGEPTVEPAERPLPVVVRRDRAFDRFGPTRRSFGGRLRSRTEMSDSRRSEKGKVLS